MPTIAPSDAETSGDALTLEALRQGLRLRGDLAACFLKAIAKTTGSEGHSVVDLWVLFCLYANQDTRKKVNVVDDVVVIVVVVVVDDGGVTCFLSVGVVFVVLVFHPLLFFLLFLMLDGPTQVMTLFRRKISSGHFTEALMADALHGRAGALTELFRSSLMGITDALVS